MKWLAVACLAAAACTSAASEGTVCPMGVCLDAAPPPSICDPTRMCEPDNSCDDGLLYPTSCGPLNCDDPLGPCTAQDAAADASVTPPPHDAALPHDAKPDAPHDAAAPHDAQDAQDRG